MPFVDHSAQAGEDRIDTEFTAYPLRELADAALQRAADLGAEHADFRAERIKGQQIGLNNGAGFIRKALVVTQFTVSVISITILRGATCATSSALRSCS